MANEIVLKNCGRQESFFKFINEHWKGRHSNNRTFHRLCSLMRKMNVQSAIVENLENGSDEEVSEEIEALSKFFDQDIEYIAYKITFINSPVESQQDLDKLDDIHFLGYGLVLNVGVGAEENEEWISYILRAIVKLPNAYMEKDNIVNHLYNRYYHIYRYFHCDVNYLDSSKNKIKKTYKLIGTFFAQQNSFTSVCAHASLKTLINNLPETHFSVTSEYINKKLGIDHRSRKIEGGLKKDQIENLLKDLNLKFFIKNYFEEPREDYSVDLHHQLESASPCLLIFAATENLHVVPVLGHTINYDMWQPEAERTYRGIQSEFRHANLWLDNFIIHDDNFGMYLLLPSGALKRKTEPTEDPEFRVHSILSISKYKIETKATEAELACQIFTKYILKELSEHEYVKELYWLQLLYNEELAPIIIRTALMNKDRYLTHLGYQLTERHCDSNEDCFSDEIIAEIAQYLPDFFWISELTLPDLYTTNKTKLIDFIYDSQKPRLELNHEDGRQKEDDEIVSEMMSKCYLVRLPGVCVGIKKGGQIDPVVFTEIYGHYPLFRVSRELRLHEF